MHSVAQEILALAALTQRSPMDFQHLPLEGSLIGQQLPQSKHLVVGYRVPDNFGLIVTHVSYAVMPYYAVGTPAPALSPVAPVESALAYEDFKFYWSQGNENRTDFTDANQLAILGGPCLHVFNALQFAALRAEAQGNIVSPSITPNAYRIRVRADAFLTEPSIAARLAEIQSLIPGIGDKFDF